MAGAPTPFVNSFQEPNIGSLRYNTSQAGSPLPIVYGTQRVNINILEFWGFQGSNAPSSKGGKGGLIGGGKSGGGGKKGGATPNFSVYVACGVCQGPASFFGAKNGSGGANRIWVNAGIAYGPASVGLNWYSAEIDGLPPDTVFAAKDPNQPILGYSGTVYVTGVPLQLGESPAMPNISFEMRGFGAGTAGPNFPDDARPDFVLTDLLTNPRYGAGFPASALDQASITDWGNFCQAANLAVSKLLDRCEPAARIIEELCAVTVSAVFFTSGVLKVIPYETQGGWTENGAAWSPNLTVRYSLTDRDFIDFGGTSDPVIVTRTDRTQITNWISTEYLDSSNAYNNNVVYTFDQGMIDSYGLRNSTVSEGHSLTNATSAFSSVNLQLRRKTLISNTYKFKLGWKYALLDPMDVVLLTDQTAGLSNTPVRITSIIEDDDGTLTFEAENIPFSVPGV